MDNSPIDDLLRASAPRRASDDPAVRAELHRVGLAARATGTRHRRIRRLSWVAVPVLALPALTLAATAGTDPRMVPDYRVSVSYVTDSGREVDCYIAFFNGELDYVETNTEVVDYFRTQDWDDIGQRIYERALELEARGQISPWSTAENDLIVAKAPDELFLNGGMGMDTDCTGELH